MNGGRDERIVADGWDAITIHCSAGEIEYSQPVLYSHFANRDAILAVAGSREIAAALREAAGPAGRTPSRRMPSRASSWPITPLRSASNTTAVLTPYCADAELVTESFWAALHRLAQLERSRSWIRPGLLG